MLLPIPFTIFRIQPDRWGSHNVYADDCKITSCEEKEAAEEVMKELFTRLGVEVIELDAIV